MACNGFRSRAQSVRPGRRRYGPLSRQRNGPSCERLPLQLPVGRRSENDRPPGASTRSASSYRLHQMTSAGSVLGDLASCRTGRPLSRLPDPMACPVSRRGLLRSPDSCRESPRRRRSLVGGGPDESRSKTLGNGVADEHDCPRHASERRPGERDDRSLLAKNMRQGAPRRPPPCGGGRGTRKAAVADRLLDEPVGGGRQHDRRDGQDDDQGDRHRYGPTGRRPVQTRRGQCHRYMA